MSKKGFTHFKRRKPDTSEPAHDEGIELEELRDALRKLNIRAGSLEADVLFRRYDVDGNGVLDHEELAYAVKTLGGLDTFGMDDAYAGFKTLAERRAVGKVVVAPGLVVGRSRL